MKQIKLTQGKYALVDDSDFEWLTQWKWYFSTGYAVRNEPRQRGNKRHAILMHKLINNTPIGMDTDHINTNRLDNRKCNLRTVTRSQNQFNRDKTQNNKSGYKGVCWHKASEKWLAQIRINNKTIYLGTYSNIQEACLARRRGESTYLKELATI